MNLHIIACRVFEPEIRVLTGDGRPDLSIEYLPLREHDRPEELRRQLQDLIDNIPSDRDAVVLAYGLCGNAAVGLKAGKVPLLIPKAHDCSGILLGSGAAHKALFADHPSRGWTSNGYLLADGEPVRSGAETLGYSLEDLIDQYGEENGRYVCETMKADDSDPVLYYLDLHETRDTALADRARRAAEDRDKELQVIPATLDLLRDLLTGRTGEEILYVPPGSVIQATWDDLVIDSTESGGETLG